jgi:hypothetical protein
MSAGRASDPAPAVSPGDSFRRIDTASAAPRVVHPASSVVEVGIDDPAHGWVAVRAESASGQVHASLSAASPESQSALRAQLAGMADYLAEREIGVRTLAVGHGAGESAGGFSPRSGGDAQGGQGREFAGSADANSNGRHQGNPQSAASGTEASGTNRAGENRPLNETGRVAGRQAPPPMSRGSGRGFSDPPHAVNVLA